MEKFPERLREALRKNNIRQVDLANKLGIEKSTISNYLSGRYEPRPATRKAIADALGVSDAWLEGHDVYSVPLRKEMSPEEIEHYYNLEIRDNTEDLTDSELKVLTAYRSADPDIQHAIRLMLKVTS